MNHQSLAPIVKHNYNLLRTQRGISLVELLVAFGLFAILMAGMASLSSVQSNEARALQETLQKLETERVLSTILMRYNVCRQEVKGKEFDATKLAAAEVELNQIRYVESTDPNSPALLKKNEKVSATSNSLVVKEIFITNMVPLPNISNPKDRFLGELSIRFKGDLLVRRIKPIVVKVIIETDPASPDTKKVIADCIVNDGGTDTCTVGNKGRIRYDVNKNEIEFCDGSDWKVYN